MSSSMRRDEMYPEEACVRSMRKWGTALLKDRRVRELMRKCLSTKNQDFEWRSGEFKHDA